MTTATLAGGFTYFEGLSISPNTGPEAGGTEITILGAGFDETTQILIGNEPLLYVTVEDSATITGITPGGVYGSYDVVAITGISLTTQVNGFTYTIDDTFSLNNISPVSGITTGGYVMTFNGNGFDANTTFTVGGEAVTNVYVTSNTTATGLVPVGTAGWTNVAAQSGVTESTLTGAFQYIEIPYFSTIVPNMSPESGGIPVTISGGGFTENTVVSFNGVPLVDPVLVSDSVITGTVPSGTVGYATLEIVDV